MVTQQGVRDLSSFPEMETVPPALAVWNLNHWTAREVPKPYLSSCLHYAQSKATQLYYIRDFVVFTINTINGFYSIYKYYKINTINLHL